MISNDVLLKFISFIEFEETIEDFNVWFFDNITKFDSLSRFDEIVDVFYSISPSREKLRILLRHILEDNFFDVDRERIIYNLNKIDNDIRVLALICMKLDVIRIETNNYYKLTLRLQGYASTFDDYLLRDGNTVESLNQEININVDDIICNLNEYKSFIVMN